MDNQKTEKGISDIVGALSDPIIVHPGGWADSLPKSLKDAIVMERLMMNMTALKGGEITGTDAEACAYLSTASLCFPFDHDWTQIFLYVTGQVFTRHGAQVPEDIRVEKLDDQQMSDLCRLKDWIYKRRIAERQERDRAERRKKREEEAAKKKAEQPVLAFEF